MADGSGECCIARWGGGGGDGHMAATAGAKMDMIMLKFRPIAPKPVLGTSAVSDGGTNIGSATRNGKAGAGRGRRKTMSPKESNNNNNNNNNNNSNMRRCTNSKKRKSVSPDQKQYQHHYDDDNNNQEDQKPDLTLLPLFPEAPDLSPKTQDQVNNNMPSYWLNFDKDGITPSYEYNYGNCHGTWW